MSKKTIPATVGIEAQKPRVGFWQRRWVQDGLPLVTSVAVHVGLLVLGLIVVHAVMKPISGHEEETIIPTMNVGPLEDAQNRPIVCPEPRPATYSGPMSTSATAFTSKPDLDLSKALHGSTGDIAFGQPVSLGSPNGDISSLKIGTDASGVGEIGPIGPGGGKAVNIFGGGQPANSKAISAIYICDGSGSLVGGKDDTLRRELKNAVHRLIPTQSFNVLLFQQSEGKKYQSLAGQLLIARPDNQHKLFEFVDNTMTFHGTTDPLPAIDEAFKEHPQLIYLLTDGAFENNDPDETQQADGAGVIAKIAALNKDKKVHVNTILLMGSKKEVDDLKDAEDVMKKIARDNGGVYTRAFADQF